jgi:hypothetical protein
MLQALTLTSKGIDTASAANADTAFTSIGICPRESAMIQNEAVAAVIEGICTQQSNITHASACEVIQAFTTLMLFIPIVCRMHTSSSS